MKILVVVEDSPDIRMLIRTVFAQDPRFAVGGESATAEHAIELARSAGPALIVLDHGLAGEMGGIEAAPLLKAAAPEAKIILFTAHGELRGPAGDEPAIDAFLLKTNVTQLLPLAQRLTGLAPAPTVAR